MTSIIQVFASWINNKVCTVVVERKKKTLAEMIRKTIAGLYSRSDSFGLQSEVKLNVVFF